MGFGKRWAPDRFQLGFGKRSSPERLQLGFGKRTDPTRFQIGFGKRSSNDGMLFSLIFKFLCIKNTPLLISPYLYFGNLTPFISEDIVICVLYLIPGKPKAK